MKSDRRVKRTNGYITEAFLKLIVSKGYAAITVQDITLEADINRSTFYYHYQDKEDLLERSMDAMIDLAEKEVMVPALMDRQEAEEGQGFEPARFYIRMFEHIGRHAEFYRVMLREVPPFGQRLSAAIQRFYQESISVLQPDEEQLLVSRQVLATYVTGAYTAVILSWLEQNPPQPPAYMAHQLSELMMNGPHQAAGLGRFDLSVKQAQDELQRTEQDAPERQRQQQSIHQSAHR
jgi:AcrR family transcriptional regulator